MNFEQAVVYWEELLAIIPADSKLAQSVSGSIEQAKALASNGKDPAVSMAQSPDLNNSSNTSSAQSAKNVTNSVEVQSHQLVQFQVLLRLVLHYASKDITRRTPFTSMLVQKDGPRMPLAIVRLQAKEFTCTIFI